MKNDSQTPITISDTDSNKWKQDKLDHDQIIVRILGDVNWYRMGKKFLLKYVKRLPCLRCLNLIVKEIKLNKKISRDTVRFLYKDETLTGEETTEGIGLQNGDIIEAVVEQIGG